MKNIQVSDEMYNKLKELANEYVTQDSRATAKPYLFQIRTIEEKVVPNEYSDVYVWYSEGEELREEHIQEYLMECLEIDEDQFHELSEYDIEDKLEERDWTKVYVRNEYKYQNAFLTAKACKEHIKSNHYHYNEPVDYLNHSWRNPEMDLISDFLINLNKVENEFKETTKVTK